MLLVHAFLLASACLSSLADASAIKGHAHARPQEDARSIKLAQVANNLDKPAAKTAAQLTQVAPVPILESTKRIYNDESIRRLAASQQAPVEQPAPKQPQVAAESPVAVVVASEPAVAKSAPVPVVVASPVVAPAAAPIPVPVPVPVAAPVVEQSAALVEPKIAAPEASAESRVVVEQVKPAIVPVEPKAVIEPKSVPVELKKPAAADELPPQSDRSAPIRNEVPPIVPAEQPAPAQAPVPVSAPVPVPVQVAPVQSAPIPVVAEQAAPVPVPVPQPAVPAAAPVQAEVARDSALEAKKEAADPLHIEVPAPDPGLVLSEPIDSTTKLLIDLDEHVQKFLPAEDQQPAAPAREQTLVAGVDYSPAQPAAADPTGKSAPLAPYSGSVEEPIVPPLPSLDGVEKASAAGSVQAAASSSPAVGSATSGSSASSSSSSSSSSSAAVSSPSATRQGGQSQNQQQVITQLLDQLDSLQNRIQDTINQLVARRRYVMSALLRPMGTYVRRVRTNLERLQNRVNQLQAAAVSVGGGQNRPGGFVDAAAIETIRRRIDDISKRISDIVNRIRFSLTPTSAPLNSNGRK